MRPSGIVPPRGNSRTPLFVEYDEFIIMTVWKGVVAGCEVKIHDVDHLPPHCHAYVGGRDARVDLRTLEVLNPPPHELPAKRRRGLQALQEELLRAWDDVTLPPPRGRRS